MKLDVSTLYLVAALISALLGALLLFFYRQQRIAALGWWASAYLIGAAVIGCWSVAGASLHPVVLAVLTSIGFVACALVWTAACVFHGKSPNWPFVALGPAVWIAATFLTSPLMKTLVGAFIVAAYAAATAGELWSERRKSLQTRWPAAAVPALHGLVLMLPVLLGTMVAESDELARPDGRWMIVFTIELVLYAVGTVFLILMVVSEQTVRVHKTAASHDPLTGLLNRRGFSEACSRMIEREARAGRPVTVMIFDIDHFKSINDRFGHPAGDEILKLFAAVVTANLRMTDLVGRIGGEEFAAMLPCALDEAVVAADRVRLAFQDCNVDAEGAPVVTTVSIGVAGGPSHTEVDVLLASADTALYRAKRGGRNRVIAAAELPLVLGVGGRRVAARVRAANGVAAPSRA